MSAARAALARRAARVHRAHPPARLPDRHRASRWSSWPRSAILAGVLGDRTRRTTYDVGVHGTEAFADRRGRTRRRAGSFDLRIELRRFASAERARAAVRDESVDAARRWAAPSSRATSRRTSSRSRSRARPRRCARRCAALSRASRAPRLARRSTRRRWRSTPSRRGRRRPPGHRLHRLAAALQAADRVRAGGGHGVVEEKASRVVEVLLASISPARAAGREDRRHRHAWA